MTVGRNFLSGFQYDDVADNDFFFSYLANIPFTDHFDERIVVYGIQYIERFVRFHFEEEPDTRCQHDSKEDTDRFEEGCKTFRFRSPAMYAGNDHG